MSKLLKSKLTKKIAKRKSQLIFLTFVFLVIAGLFLGANLKMLDNLPFLSSTYRPLRSESLSAGEFSEMMENKDFILINVHTPYEGEIEGTDAFITYDEILANKERLPQNKRARIVLYCKTGRMSRIALGTLKSMGYTNIAHLDGGMDRWGKAGQQVLDLSQLPEQVLPEEGFTLPLTWGDIGPKLVSSGVIDMNKLEGVMPLSDEEKTILTQTTDIPIKITMENSRFVVNILWALGLAQKSLVYEEGPMGKEYKDTVGNFASTGGWTLARGDAVNYLNRYDLIPLTPEQHKLVGEIAKNVYRPCCGNSTWFPDCNHGMAALAAIELLVSKGVPEEEIYRHILALNSFWFPDNYLIAATYFGRQGVEWKDVDAKEVLGETYSSGQGAGELYQRVGPLPYNLEGVGGSCGA